MLFRNDPFFASAFSSGDRWFAPPTERPAPGVTVDAIRHDDSIELRFDLPGVAVDDIDLTVDGDLLSLNVTRTFEIDAESGNTEGDRVISHERWHGERSRSFRLGDQLDTEELSSSYENGVLTVTIPVRTAEQPRRIEIAA